jgi:hypothetical protein
LNDTSAVPDLSSSQWFFKKGERTMYRSRCLNDFNKPAWLLVYRKKLFGFQNYDVVPDGRQRNGRRKLWCFTASASMMIYWW